MLQLALSEGERFSGLFICPSGSQEAFRHCHKFTSIDVCHTKTSLGFVLQLATGLDAEDRIIVFAWGLAPSESYETWIWFIERLVAALPTLNSELSVVISDRQKVCRGRPLWKHRVLTSLHRAF